MSVSESVKRGESYIERKRKRERDRERRGGRGGGEERGHAQLRPWIYCFGNSIWGKRDVCGAGRRRGESGWSTHTVTISLLLFVEREREQLERLRHDARYYLHIIAHEFKAMHR